MATSAAIAKKSERLYRKKLKESKFKQAYDTGW